MSRPEDERVKIPALLHLTRLGYQYVSLKENAYDGDTDIFVDVFRDAVCRLNDYSFSDAEINTMLQDFKQVLDTEDLGKQFYNYLLKGYNGVTLIDFNHPERNTWQIATELPCVNGQDEFRPDITILINGIPLAFIEVKRPNNKDGIQAEYDRMNRRVQNRKFRRFINMTQLMVFSNNGEYDDNEAVPLEGAYYATIGYEKLFFSHFREEDDSIFTRVAPLDETIESKILTDTNLVTIKSAPDYQTNTSPMTPTHRMLTSLFSKDRLLFLLRYGLAYVERTDDNGIKHLEKHVMRYPQIFATKAIEEKLNHNDMFVFHGERDITEAGLSSCSAILMPAGSVLMSSRAPIGYLAIAANPVCTNQGFKSIICTKDYGTLFVYYTLKRNVQGIARQGVGTTFKEVSRDTLARYTVLLPDTTIAKHFEQLIAPISQTRKNCEQENRELIALRDWLLPMLMNGQAKVE